MKYYSYNVTVLEILPIGSVQPFWLEYLQSELESYFSRVLISPPAYLPLYYNERGQVLADRLLDSLKGYPTRASRVLAVIDKDITVRGVNYIFGLAALGGRCAVISPVRLMERFYNRECDYELFLERLLKEALHELGHTFGLSHCKSENCNMKFSSTVHDIDRRPALFCESCFSKIQKYTLPSAGVVYAANGEGGGRLLRLVRRLLGRSKQSRPSRRI